MTAQPASVLSLRLNEGPLPTSDALRFGSQIADALRRLHEGGSIHGALTPDCIVIDQSGAHLVPAEYGAVTPYTAPERLSGHAPDARTDIFAFGALLYEMLSCRRAFDGDDSDALAQSIANATPPPLGRAGLDRLLANCLAKEPAGRWQRIQQVQMELKMLSIGALREDAAVAARQPRPEAILRSQIVQLEARVVSMLAEHEAATADLRRVTGEQTVALQAGAASLGEAQQQISALQSQLAAARERADGAEQFSDGLRRDFGDLEQTVKAHASSIESMRAAMARTDDFLERVVEALESLQNMVLDQAHRTMDETN